MAFYITPHAKGGWRYQKATPVALRPLLRGKTAYVKYIPRMSKRAAEGIAAAYALGHAAELASLKAMPGPVAETVIAQGE
jgi:hypothetical protein